MPIFEPFGVIGWDTIQFPMIAALVAGVPPLLVGDHGTYKTDGARDLARFILGSNARVRVYDTSALTSDELLGFPDPKSLSERNEDGQLMIRYGYHKLCVWLQDAVVLDEINMASMGVTSRLHELVRDGRVMGERTPIKLRFGTLNPPSKYATYHMNPAFASRFATIEVPPVYGMKEQERKKLMRTGKIVWDLDSEYAVKLRKAILIAMMILRAETYTENDYEAVVTMVDSILEAVSPLGSSVSGAKFTPVLMSGRQTKNLVRMFLAIEAFKAAAKAVDLDIDDEFTATVDTSNGDKRVNATNYDLGLLLIAKAAMPECHGIVKRQTNWQTIMQRLNTIVRGFRLDDAMAVSRDISLYAAQRIVDAAEFTQTVSDAIEDASNLEIMKNTYAALVENPDVQTKLDADGEKKLRRAIVDKCIDLKFPPEAVMGPGVLMRLCRQVRDADYKKPEMLEATDLMEGLDVDDVDMEELLEVAA